MDSLHIYNQGFWHDRAAIVGTREALWKLGRQLMRAAKGSAIDDYQASDGEAYCVIAVTADVDNLPLPYSDVEVAAAGEWERYGANLTALLVKARRDEAP